jgi:hypothetical protein
VVKIVLDDNKRRKKCLRQKQYVSNGLVNILYSCKQHSKNKMMPVFMNTRKNRRKKARYQQEVCLNESYTEKLEKWKNISMA